MRNRNIVVGKTKEIQFSGSPVYFQELNSEEMCCIYYENKSHYIITSKWFSGCIFVFIEKESEDGKSFRKSLDNAENTIYAKQVVVEHTALIYIFKDLTPIECVDFISSIEHESYKKGAEDAKKAIRDALGI